MIYLFLQGRIPIAFFSNHNLLHLFFHLIDISSPKIKDLFSFSRVAISLFFLLILNHCKIQIEISSISFNNKQSLRNVHINIETLSDKYIITIRRVVNSNLNIKIKIKHPS